MNKTVIFSLVCLLGVSLLFGHEGHKEVTMQVGRPHSWMQWFGSFHFIFLHFPIALITMGAVSELLYSWYQKPIFDQSSRFMLIAAAVLAVPTAVLGLTYSYTAAYHGLLAYFMEAHMWLGISTAVLAIIVVYLRESQGRNALYYSSLLLLFLLVNVTAFLGGGMTFGPYQLYPPL